MEKPRILIVEDDRIIAGDLKEWLESSGHHVPAVVGSGEEAVKAVEVFKPDLVLMDVVLLGDMDGIRAAQTIRRKSDVPVVYLTAYDDDDTRLRADATHPAGYLLKPFNDREFRLVLDSALMKRGFERRLAAAERWLAGRSSVPEEALIAVDAGGKISALNSMGESLTGWSSREAVGIDGASIYRVFARENRGLLQPLSRRVSEGLAVHDGGDRILLARSGTERVIGEALVPLRGEDGEMRGALAFFRPMGAPPDQ